MEGTMAEIRMFAGTFAPQNWAFCEGQLIAISSNQALFSLIGTTYGGDGRTSFGLPDFRSRVPVGVGMGPALSPYTLGKRGGAESVVLSQLQLPAHTHTVQASGASTITGTVDVKIPTASDAEEPSPANAYLGVSSTPLYGEDKATGSYMGATEVDSTLAVSTTVDVEVGQTGGSQPLYNIQPYLGMHYIICTDGLYPTRP